MKDANTQLLHDESLVSKIYFIRGQKVMLDRDLAELYGIETNVLKQAVKRNISRFPSDFMFGLMKPEFENLRSQFVTSSWGGTRYAPMAFTEQGIIMLSSVLGSQRAVDVNIRVVRLFIRLREIVSSNKEILQKLTELEKRMDSTNADVQNIFAVLRELVNPPQPSPEPQREQIGYKRNNKA